MTDRFKHAETHNGVGVYKNLRTGMLGFFHIVRVSHVEFVTIEEARKAIDEMIEQAKRGRGTAL